MMVPSLESLQTGFMAPVMLTAIFALLAKMQRGFSTRGWNQEKYGETQGNIMEHVGKYGKTQGNIMNMWENMENIRKNHEHMGKYGET